MDKAFITIVQKLVAEQGKDALLNAAKCKGLLADYTAGEYKKESRLLLQVIETGCQNEIAATDNIDSVKQQIVKKLQDEEFIAEQFAVDIVDLLSLVLRGEVKKKPERVERKKRDTEEKAEIVSLQKAPEATNQAMDAELKKIRNKDYPEKLLTVFAYAGFAIGLIFGFIWAGDNIVLTVVFGVVLAFGGLIAGLGLGYGVGTIIEKTASYIVRKKYR
jgi:hypothetical protein